MSVVDPLKPTFFRVVEKVFESHDVATITIEPPEGCGTAFAPGQFNMLYAFGVGEVPISISGDPVHKGTYVHTIKAVGKVSEALCNMEVGQQVGIRGPFGTSWPVDACHKRDIVIVCGGIGLAPLRSMIHLIINNRDDYGKVSLLYGAREPKEMIYTEALEEWAQALGGHVYTTVDFADSAWSGNVGVVPELITHVPYSIKNAIALVCGPEVMIRFTVKELLAHGIPSDDIYISMERNMKCAIGHCGRCQHLTNFICKDGPVFPFSKVQPFFEKKEL